MTSIYGIYRDEEEEETEETHGYQME